MSESGCLPSVVVACEDRSGMGVVVVEEEGVVGMRVPHTVVVGVGDEDMELDNETRDAAAVCQQSASRCE